mgnify:CR=1 FL=1
MPAPEHVTVASLRTTPQAINAFLAFTATRPDLLVKIMRRVFQSIANQANDEISADQGITAVGGHGA